MPQKNETDIVFVSFTIYFLGKNGSKVQIYYTCE